MYIIFGCGVTGNAVVDALNNAGREILIVDKDENALSSWKEQGIKVVASDMNAFDLNSQYRDNSIIFAILTGDFDSNLSLVKKLKEKLPNNFVLAKAYNSEEARSLEANGADMILNTGDVLTNTVLSAFENVKMKHSAFTLVNMIKESDGKEMAIFLQDNPDPDAIASGLTLQYICKYCDLESKLYYGGAISHQNNRALINLLNLDLISIKTEEAAMDVVRSSGKVALIEASIPSRNNVLPEGVTPNLIFDHHPVDTNLVKGDFVDIQTDIGATATIMTKYIRQLNLEPDISLATALLYGIRTDTKEFTRNTSPDDMKAATYLSPLVDKNIMSQLEHPPMGMETLDIIGRAINNKEIRGAYLTSFVEFISDRDALPQAAEMMLHLEGVYTVLVFGINDDQIQLSARSRDPKVNLGHILQNAFGELNSGGHATMAAGAIKLEKLGDTNDKTSLLKATSDDIKKRFFSSVEAELESKIRPIGAESQVDLV